MKYCCKNKAKLLSLNVFSSKNRIFEPRFMPMKKKWIGWVVALALLALGIVLLYAFGPVEGPMPLWMSILPPLVAIAMALLIKEVISSLFVGILMGTFLMALYGGASPASALGGGLLRVVDAIEIGSVV